MARRWTRFGFAGLIMVFGFAGWASADDGPPDTGAMFGGPPAEAPAGDYGSFQGGDPAEPQHWCAGVDGTFFHVERHDPPGVDITTTANPIVNDPGSNTLNSDYGAGPLVWVGAGLGDCWGVRGRFWAFRDNASGTTGDPDALNGIGTNSFSAGSYTLDAYTIDVEATRTFEDGPWCFEASVGGRYAQMRQNALLTFYEPVDQTTAFGSATRRIGGTGITASLEARRRLGCSGWSAFANGRGSVLWGSSDGLSTIAADAYFGADSFVSDAASFDNTTTTMYIVDAQAGVEWTHPVKCFCGTLFFRGAFEYQRWSAKNEGAATATGTAFGEDVTTTLTSSTPTATIGLIGLDMSAGFRF